MRFTRDKRGYETTSLVHASRRNGRSRQQILYWFRTPPGVKVGRPALDEDAIRSIEEQNPDIEFDWPRILEAQPAAPPSADDSRARRSRSNRDRPRPPRPAAPQPVPAAGSDRPGPPSADIEGPELADRLESEAVEPESLESEPPGREPVELEPLELEPLELEPLELEPLEPEIAQAVEQLSHPEAEETIDTPATTPDHTHGREQLPRLRARYAELLARIAERGGEPERVAALRAEAEALNPDTWVTSEDVRQGLESFEPKIRDLRAALGLRRRRRSRRGGRRRRGEQPGPATPPETESREDE